MTDDHPFDTERLTELVYKYREADSHEERREIETEILRETAWTRLPEDRGDRVVVDQDDVQRLQEQLPEEAASLQEMLAEQDVLGRVVLSKMQVNALYDRLPDDSGLAERLAVDLLDKDERR